MVLKKSDPECTSLKICLGIVLFNILPAGILALLPSISRVEFYGAQVQRKEFHYHHTRVSCDLLSTGEAEKGHH